MDNKVWVCPKCNTSGTIQDKKDKSRNRESFSSVHNREKVSMTSGGMSKFFNVQNQKFYVITCYKCSFSEFYRLMLKLGKILLIFLEIEKAT